MSMKVESRELIFVYGTLKAKGRFHYLIERNDGKFKCNWRTGAMYTMVDLGSYPGVLQGGETAIHGELYSVKSLTDFDNLEGYPELYTRKRILTSFGSAWMYIYNMEVSNDRHTWTVPTGYWRIK